MANDSTITTTSNTYITTSGTQVLSALHHALEWAEALRIVSDGASTDNGGCSFWRWVIDASSKLDVVYLGRVADAEGQLLEGLTATGKARVNNDTAAELGNIVWCSRGDTAKVFVSTGRLTASAFHDPAAPWLCFQGKLQDLPEGFDTHFGRLAERSTVLSRGASSGNVNVVPSGPVSYRRVLRLASRVVPRGALADGFVAATEEEQTTILWTTLFGEGGLDMDKAVRLSAQRLRVQESAKDAVLEEHDIISGEHVAAELLKRKTFRPVQRDGR